MTKRAPEQTISFTSLQTTSRLTHSFTRTMSTSSLNIVIKPTAGGSKFTLQVEPNNSIAELKAEVAKHCGYPGAEQRLIYKGQILKDELTVASYGTVPVPCHGCFLLLQNVLLRGMSGRHVKLSPPYAVEFLDPSAERWRDRCSRH